MSFAYRHFALGRGDIGFLKTAMLALLVLMADGVTAHAAGPAYSIREIQYTTHPDGQSTLEGQVVDCRGGIVTHKYGGFKPKLTIQDPNHPSGWGAIQVKDWLNGAPLFHAVSIGDWIALANVFVEEFRGNTTLQCLAANNPVVTIVSRGNPLPEPREIALEEIAAPVQDALGEWYVATHDAEKYEHMRLTVRKVTVVAMNLGKAADNYVLQGFADQNHSASTCWAGDYMNADTVGKYHPYTSLDQRFCDVEGILEQYTNTREGWDYYQLVTTTTLDFLMSQTADFDSDCDVDFFDFFSLAEKWLADCLAEPDACHGVDLDEDGLIYVDDLALFSEHWLEGKTLVSRSPVGQ